MRRLLFVLIAGAIATGPLAAQERTEAGDSVSASFSDADLRMVVQALSRYLPRPVIQTGIPSVRVSLETPRPIARADVLPLLRALVEAHNLELIEEPSLYRVRPRAAPAPAAPAPAAQGQSTTGGIQLFVVRLRHARAADVASTVDQLFGGGGRFSGSAELSSGTLSDELRRNNVPAVSNAGPAAGSRAAGGADLRGPVTVVPDEITNSLLVRSTPEDFATLQRAVGELDIRPLQVLIEVLIVEARADRSFSLGTDLFLPTQSLGSGDATASATLTSGGLGDLVIHVLNIGSANVNATIRAQATRGNVRIVSRPVLLAANNTEARLLVGSQRPFVQVSRSLPTDAPSRDQVVQYRDVGTRLVVRPTINHDGYVSLNVQQEVNAATTEVAFDAPVISTREAATRVLVRDGQTVMLGGLRDTQHDQNSNGIPFLSDLPLIGGLFGRNSMRKTSTELYLFLTPRILRTDDDADSVTARRLPRDIEP